MPHVLCVRCRTPPSLPPSSVLNGKKVLAGGTVEVEEAATEAENARSEWSDDSLPLKFTAVGTVVYIILRCERGGAETLLERARMVGGAPAVTVVVVVEGRVCRLCIAMIMPHAQQYRCRVGKSRFEVEYIVGGGCGLPAFGFRCVC